MSATPPAPSSRPRTVDAAFWCWLVGAILTAALGMLIASQDSALFIRGAGVILVVVGLAQGYLAGRMRKGQTRFASAGVGLAMASVAFLAVLILFGGKPLGALVVAVIMVLLIAGSVLIQRGSAQKWLESGALE
jgi:hypothetical protein